MRLGIAGNARQPADGLAGLRAVDVPFTILCAQQEGAVVGIEGLLGIGGQPGAVAYPQGLWGLFVGVVGQAGDTAVIGGVFRGNAHGRTPGIGHGALVPARRQGGKAGQRGFAQIAYRRLVHDWGAGGGHLGVWRCDGVAAATCIAAAGTCAAVAGAVTARASAIAWLVVAGAGIVAGIFAAFGIAAVIGVAVIRLHRGVTRIVGTLLASIAAVARRGFDIPVIGAARFVCGVTAISCIATDGMAVTARACAISTSMAISGVVLLLFATLAALVGIVAARLHRGIIRAAATALAGIVGIAIGGRIAGTVLAFGAVAAGLAAAGLIAAVPAVAVAAVLACIWLAGLAGVDGQRGRGAFAAALIVGCAAAGATTTAGRQAQGQQDGRGRQDAGHARGMMFGRPERAGRETGCHVSGYDWEEVSGSRCRWGGYVIRAACVLRPGCPVRLWFG